MSFIDKQQVIEAYTTASLNILEKVLVKQGYKVIKNNISITATLKTFGGYNSNILILDQNGVRYCKDTETATGMLCNPKMDRLQNIITISENIQKRMEEAKNNGK